MTTETASSGSPDRSVLLGTRRASRPTGATWSERQRPGPGGTGDRARYEALLNDLAVTEEFHGYPGLQLMAALKEAPPPAMPRPSLALATRIVQALMTSSFRQHAGDWSVNDDGNGGVPDLLPPVVRPQRGAPTSISRP